MQNENFTTTIVVDQSPETVFAAINDVRGWWSGAFEGATDKLGAEFTYRYQELHRSTQRVTELVPGKKVVWRVIDSYLAFVEDKSEWTGTEIVFEISQQKGKTELRFTHVGLVPRQECYGSCFSAWTSLIQSNLRDFIATKAPQADVLSGTGEVLRNRQAARAAK
jgi:uncharacterized protein YndB with AHSA1/START domain